MFYSILYFSYAFVVIIIGNLIRCYVHIASKTSLLLNVLCVANVERCTRVHIHHKDNINTYYIQVKC